MFISYPIRFEAALLLFYPMGLKLTSSQPMNNDDDDIFRVLQIKFRLHESQMRERDVRVSIKRLFRGGEGEMTSISHNHNYARC